MDWNNYRNTNRKLFKMDVKEGDSMNKNLNMVRGDTLAFAIEIEGLNQDLDTCYFSCKKDPTDEDYIFQKELNDGIEKVSTNKYKIRVAPSDTANIDIGNYYYDLQIGVNSDVFTVLRGVLKIEREITGE